MTAAAVGDLLLVLGANPLYGLNRLGGALALGAKSGLSHPGIEAELSITVAARRPQPPAGQRPAARAAVPR